MNMTKKINVNFSSLVGLKAELLRKQAEVNEAKLKTESVNVSSPLNKRKSKKQATTGEGEKNVRESIDPEDIIAHKKARLMLEAKARLYEKLKKSKNNDDKFLVNFEIKMDDPDEEVIDKAIDEKYPIEPEENWVEYQDCFGRTRKCLREDLPHMQKKDELIKQEVMKKRTDEDKEEEIKEQYFVQEKEPEIEIMRRKWEEQMQKLADKADIHYQDILFDEARTHGVSYYAFSQDEEERLKQQESLANLRKETERKQRETKELKELKDRMEQNRLKAARIRQRIRAGLPAEPTEEELAQEKLIDSTRNINASKNESVEKDKEKSDEKTEESKNSNESIQETNEDEDKIKAFGELLDKKNHWHVMSQEEWVDKCRAQRISEFGPVYNFTNTEFYKNSQSINQQSDACKKYVEESNNLLNPEDNDSVNTEATARDDEKNEKSLSGNIVSTLDTTSLLEKKSTVSYPVSYLSSNSRNVRDYPGMFSFEQQKQTDDMDIPLPGENDISSSASISTSHINEHESLSRSINEDNIMAGLKYLREKFEASHSKCT